ncbi:MAG: serine hydrolase [Verrucomicrobia bacterium]|nr:serine hydrolase [Cytophagales bacterium]
MKITVLFLSLFLFTNLLFSQPIDKKLKGFDEYVAKAMKDWKVQGLAIAIIQKDKIVFAKGYGLRNVAQKLPVTPETVFAIGSCTKAFTAASVLLLADDSKLDPDKPVREYMPDFKLFDAYASDNMTARDLLCHRSGLPRHDLAWYGADFSRQELFERLRFLEPTKPFRTDFQYQNLMFVSAGHLVEQISKQKWEDFTKEKIIKPLEMTYTNFSVTEMPKMPDHSLGYTEKKEKVETMPFRNLDAAAPAGAINASVKDMANWVACLINGGRFKGKQILSQSAVNQMQTPYMVIPTALSFPETFYNSYGLGWFITSYRGHVRVEHGGNIDGFTASTCFFPKDSVGIVILANMNGTAINSVLRNDLTDRILGLSSLDWNKRLTEQRAKTLASAEKVKNDKEDSRKKNTKPSHALKDYVGKFLNSAYGTMEIVEVKDSLRLKFHGFDVGIRHFHYDIFEVTDEEDFENAKITFITDNTGEISQLGIAIEPSLGKNILFDRKNDFQPTKTMLESYLGNYELGGVIIKVFFKGETTLMLNVPGQPDYELVPVREHEFDLKTLKGYSVVFKTDDRKQTTEVTFRQPNGNFTAKKK